jgi:hypothetical protein
VLLLLLQLLAPPLLPPPALLPLPLPCCALLLLPVLAIACSTAVWQALAEAGPLSGNDDRPLTGGRERR